MNFEKYRLLSPSSDGIRMPFVICGMTLVRPSFSLVRLVYICTIFAYYAQRVRCVQSQSFYRKNNKNGKGTVLKDGLLRITLEYFA